MDEYIERKALDKALTVAAANDKDKNRRTWAKAICVLHDLHAADVAPVVHCKDCRYWGDADGISTNVDGVRFARCRAHNHYVAGMHIGWCYAEDDFCSYGAREDGDSDGE